MGNPNPVRTTPFAVGNQANTKHGGSGALARIHSGESFLGIAQECYLELIEELGINLDTLSGVERVRFIRAARFETAARLYDNAALAAAAKGDLAAWDGYNRRSGWIGSKGFAALGEFAGRTDDMMTIDGAITAAGEVLDGEN